MPVPFSKCGKKADDLLKKGYEWGRKVTLKTSTPNGVKYTSTGSLAGGKKGKSSAGSMKGSFEAQYKHPSGFHLDKLAVDSTHQLDCDISLNGQAEGLKFTLACTIQDFNMAIGELKEKAVVGVEYQNKDLDLSMSAKMDPSNSFKSYADLLVGYEGYSVGGCITGKMAASTPEVTGFGGKLGYKCCKDAEMTISATGKVVKGGMPAMAYKVGVLNNLSKELAFATVINYNAQKPKPADRVSLKAGGKYCLDPETTFQAMLDQKALLSLSYSQKLRPMLKLTSSAQMDMGFVGGAEAKASKFGFGLELGDI